MPSDKAPAHRAIRSNLAVALSLSIHGVILANGIYFARSVPLTDARISEAQKTGDGQKGQERNKDGFDIPEIDDAVKRATESGKIPKDEKGAYDSLYANGPGDFGAKWRANPLSGFPPGFFQQAGQTSAAGMVMFPENPQFNDLGNLLSLAERRPQELQISDGPQMPPKTGQAKPGSQAVPAVERRPVADLEAARAGFISQLVRDMNDDPEGNLRLGSMGFIDFFVRSWYLDNAIERIGSGKRPDASEQELQDAFGQIRAAAQSKTVSTDPPLVRIKKFHAAMTSYFDGYEAKHADIYSALIGKVVNCNGSTEVGTAGYVSSDHSVMLNWFSADPANGYDAHVQSALLYNGRYVTIENTARASPLRYHHGGALTKPEAFVIQYLVSHGTSLSQMPKEASRIIDAIRNAPKSVMRSPSGYLAYEGVADFSSSLDIIDKPIAPSSAPFSGTVSSGTGDASRSASAGPGARNTKAPARVPPALISQSYLYTPFTRNENVKMAVATAKLYLQNIDFASESQKIEDLYSSDKKKLTCVARRMLDVATIMREPSALERLGLYERIRNSRKRSVETVMPERDILDPSIRDADPVSGRMGLLGDLIGEGEESGWSGPMPVIFPKADYQALTSDILDNGILLYGTDFPSVVKSIHMRSIALTRAEAFGGLDGSHIARSQKRADMLLRVIAGEKVDGIENEFAGHYGFKADRIVPLEKMAKDNGRTGISLLALEDIISFRGEKAAIEAATAYMGRKDVRLGRIGYEKILLSLESRLIFESGSLRSSLGGLLDEDALRIEAKAAIAHFLYEKGSRDERIPKVLSRYLREAHVIPADAISLAGHGLDRNRIGKILAEKLNRDAHLYSEITTALGYDGNLEKIMEKNDFGKKYEINRGSIVRAGADDIVSTAQRMFDSFESLMMLGFRTEAMEGLTSNAYGGGTPHYSMSDFVALAARYRDTSLIHDPFSEANVDAYFSGDFDCFGNIASSPQNWETSLQNRWGYGGLMRLLPKDVDIDKVSREYGQVPAFITYPNELRYEGRTTDAISSYLDYMTETNNFTPQKHYTFTTEMEGLFWVSTETVRRLADPKKPEQYADIRKRLDDTIRRRARSLASEGVCPTVISPLFLHMNPISTYDFSGFLDEIIGSEMLHDLMERRYPEMKLLTPELMDRRCEAREISFVLGRDALDGLHPKPSTKGWMYELIEIMRPHRTLRNEDIHRLIEESERSKDEYHAALLLAVKGYLDFDSHGDVAIIHPPKPIRAKNK